MMLLGIITRVRDTMDGQLYPTLKVTGVIIQQPVSLTSARVARQLKPIPGNRNEDQLVHA